MSSMTLWQCPITGVTAEWNKGTSPTVFVPHHTDAEGITHGTHTSHVTNEAAIAAAKRKAKAILTDGGTERWEFWFTRTPSGPILTKARLNGARQDVPTLPEHVCAYLTIKPGALVARLGSFARCFTPIGFGYDKWEAIAISGPDKAAKS